MIAEAVTGNGFMGLADYLMYGPTDSLDPDRMDWVESRNLPTANLQAGARLMRAAARDSPRTRKPVYHLSISFDPKDTVDRAIMRAVADRTLSDLGLQEHQAIIVAHRDRAHAHLHIMVNRVHPERGTAWSNSWDYARIERSLREQEKALGLRVVPGRHTREPGRKRAPALVRGDANFVTAVQRDAAPHLARAQSWAELERGLATHGLSIRVHNGGFIFTDGVRKVKASEVDRAASRRNLERRLGSLGAYRARQAAAARALEGRSVQVEDAAKAAASRATAASPLPPAPIVPAQAEPERPNPLRDVAPAPPEPARRPAPQVAKVPEQQAEPATPPPATAPTPAAIPRRRRITPPEWWHSPLRRAAELVLAARRTAAEVRRLGDSFEDGYVKAPQELKRLKQLRQQAEKDKQQLVSALREVFPDAAAVSDKLLEYGREHDMALTLAALQSMPEQFGALRTAGLFRSTTRARERLADVVEPLQAAILSAREGPTDDELQAAEQRAADGIKTGIAAREARSPLLLLPAQYEREAADLLRSLLREASPQWIAHQVAWLLPPEDREAAEIATRVLTAASKTLSRGPGHGIGW